MAERISLLSLEYGADDLLPLSALQHLLFCERRSALVHIEQVWKENRFTELFACSTLSAEGCGAGEERGPVSGAGGRDHAGTGFEWRGTISKKNG